MSCFEAAWGGDQLQLLILSLCGVAPWNSRRFTDGPPQSLPPRSRRSRRSRELQVPPKWLHLARIMQQSASSVNHLGPSGTCFKTPVGCHKSPGPRKQGILSIQHPLNAKELFIDHPSGLPCLVGVWCEIIRFDLSFVILEPHPAHTAHPAGRRTPGDLRPAESHEGGQYPRPLAEVPRRARGAMGWANNRRSQRQKDEYDDSGCDEYDVGTVRVMARLCYHMGCADVASPYKKGRELG